MDKLNSMTVQLGAFDSLLRILLAVKSESELQEIHTKLLHLWVEVEGKNTHSHLTGYLKASKEMALKMTEGALREHSLK